MDRSKADLGTFTEDEMFDAAAGAPGSLALRWGAVTGQRQGA